MVIVCKNGLFWKVVESMEDAGRAVENDPDAEEARNRHENVEYSAHLLTAEEQSKIQQLSGGTL
jgi:hypothetical protein